MVEGGGGDVSMSTLLIYRSGFLSYVYVGWWGAGVNLCVHMAVGVVKGLGLGLVGEGGWGRFKNEGGGSRVGDIG